MSDVDSLLVLFGLLLGVGVLTLGAMVATVLAHLTDAWAQRRERLAERRAWRVRAYRRAFDDKVI